MRSASCSKSTAAIAFATTTLTSEVLTARSCVSRAESEKQSENESKNNEFKNLEALENIGKTLSLLTRNNGVTI